MRGCVSEHRGPHRQIPKGESGSRSDVSADPGLVSAFHRRGSGIRRNVSGLRRAVGGFRSNVSGVSQS
jgi:hypothetical protein